MPELPAWIMFAVFFISSVFLSFLINGLFLKFSRSLGIRNSEETIIRWGSQSKPALGGISFYILFLFSVTIYSVFLRDYSLPLDKQFLGVLLAVTLGFLIGLADDAYNTKPFLKFSGQLASALILIYSGVYIHFFANEYLNYLLTVFWVVGMMNSINMLDNMDAITASVSSFIIISAVTIIIVNNTEHDVYQTICLGVLGSIIGFLFFNWHPSKIYMGDTGSQFLGVFLAVIGIMFFWNDGFSTSTLSQSKNFIGVALIFALPIIDTTTVTINRLRKGKSPFVGGRDHTTHHLALRLRSDSKVAWVFMGISLVSLILFVVSRNIKEWNNYYAFIFAIYFIIVFGFLYLPTLRTKKGKKNK
ncbi:MAG: MraY family glycosyltransferase [Bacteroidota bacterium]